MVIEEYYDNILLLTRLEKGLNNVLNHQIYMHYHIFGRVQSFATSVSIIGRKNENELDSNTLE